jgi:hypothetical protein
MEPKVRSRTLGRKNPHRGADQLGQLSIAEERIDNPHRNSGPDHPSGGGGLGMDGPGPGEAGQWLSREKE